MWAEKKEYYPLMLFVNFLLPLFSGEIIMGHYDNGKFSSQILTFGFSDSDIRTDCKKSPSYSQTGTADEPSHGKCHA